MSARHDWRHRPTEQSLEPVETASTYDDWDRDDLISELGRRDEPRVEASGELLSATELVRAVSGYLDAQPPTVGRDIALGALERLAASHESTAENALREALGKIRDRDWVENTLDPQWAAEIARTAILAHKALKDTQP